jgi:hypothetical protein
MSQFQFLISLYLSLSHSLNTQLFNIDVEFKLLILDHVQVSKIMNVKNVLMMIMSQDQFVHQMEMSIKTVVK